MLNAFQVMKISLIIMGGILILKPPFKIVGKMKIAGDLHTFREWMMKMGPGFILAGYLMAGNSRHIRQYFIQLIPFFTMVYKFLCQSIMYY